MAYWWKVSYWCLTGGNTGVGLLDSGAGDSAPGGGDQLGRLFLTRAPRDLKVGSGLQGTGRGAVSCTL